MGFDDESLFFPWVWVFFGILHERGRFGGLIYRLHFVAGQDSGHLEVE
jgi:hypothetical protein